MMRGALSRWGAGIAVICAAAGLGWLVIRPDGSTCQPVREPGEEFSLPADESAAARLNSPQVATTCDSHSLTVSALVARAKANEQLAPSDIQSLLAFISAPKPSDLTDGEWEERVNGILNLLRRQTQDFKTQDTREDQAGSGATSLPPDSITSSLPSQDAVPGLTKVLLEMAERNGSKVLRLYAMQHLSLWYAKVTGAGERKRIVGLLETLATREGEETAGCALLMLADIRRKTEEGETQDFKTQDAREEGASSLAGSGAADGPRSPLQDGGIDWERVDGVLASAGGRLIADGDAPPDVRISAIHAAVDRKDAGPLPESRKIAADAGLVSTLRKVAIHALGQLGTAEDMALLDSLPQDDPNLSQAVNPARKALADRTGR